MGVSLSSWFTFPTTLHIYSDMGLALSECSAIWQIHDHLNCNSVRKGDPRANFNHNYMIGLHLFNDDTRPLGCISSLTQVGFSYSCLLPRYGAFDLGLAVSVPLPIVTGIFVLLWFQSRLTQSCKEIVCNIFIHRWSGDYYFCTWIISLAVL